MCRKDLASYLTWLNAMAAARGGLDACHTAAVIPLDRSVERLLRRHYGAESEERRAQIEADEAAAGGEERADDEVKIPIFVCSMAMPAVACPLHIFEPRYRLMMRRCLESGQRQFGMCPSPECEYGTMLRILQFDQLPDGRSAIKTVGTRRFQVLEWGVKDGYATGRVRWITDSEVDVADDNEEQVSAEAIRLRTLVDQVLGRSAINAQVQQQLDMRLGPRPPSDGSDGRFCPSFVFWCAALSSFPDEQCFALCYADKYRQHPQKRLQAVLAHFEACVRRNGQGGQPSKGEGED